MEILIPGIALVALMVYVSTRIKRSAAKAFDEELIETPDFAIKKPEGFIAPADGNGIAFAAYSKEFGTGGSDSTRQVSAELRIHNSAGLEEVRDAIVSSASKLCSEQHLAGRSLMLETETTQKGNVLETDHRLIEKDGQVFALAVTALSDTKEDQQRKIDTFLSSFEVK